MKAKTVKIEDVLAVMRAEGEISDETMAMVTIIVPLMNEMYEKGYADGMADGKAAKEVF